MPAEQTVCTRGERHPGVIFDVAGSSARADALDGAPCDASPLMMGMVELLETDVLHLQASCAAARTLFGRTPGEVQGRRGGELGLEPDRIRQWHMACAQACRTGSPTRFDSTQQTPDGPIHLSALVWPGPCPPGANPRLGYMIEDATERKLSRTLEIDRAAALEMVAEDRPIAQVLHRVAALLDHQVPQGAGAAFFVEDGRVKVVGPSLPARLLEELCRRATTLAAGICSHPVGKCPALQVVDLSMDPLFAPCLQAMEGLGCCWSSPIRSSEGVFLGMMVVFAPGVRSPRASEAHALAAAARMARLALEHRQMSELLHHRIRHDVLTGLPNRILLDDRLGQAMSLARRNGRHVGLLAIDLDRFKAVNDTLGHQAGDVLLQQFAQRVLQALRETDTLARLGGDEFVAILPDMDAESEAQAMAARVRSALARTFSLCGQDVAVSASIGVAVYPRDGADAPALHRAADAAMYAAKQGRLASA